MNTYNSHLRHIYQPEKNTLHQVKLIIVQKRFLTHKNKSNIKFNTSPCQKNLIFRHQLSHMHTFHPKKSKNNRKTLTFLQSPAQLPNQVTHQIHRSKLICHQITHINNRTMKLKLLIIRNHNMIIKIMNNPATIIIHNNTNDRQNRHRINTQKLNEVWKSWEIQKLCYLTETEKSTDVRTWSLLIRNYYLLKYFWCHFVIVSAIIGNMQPFASSLASPENMWNHEIWCDCEYK